MLVVGQLVAVRATDDGDDGVVVMPSSFFGPTCLPSGVCCQFVARRWCLPTAAAAWQHGGH